MGEAHFPGEPSCTRIGSPCPEGDFPEGLPMDGVVWFVSEGAEDGDGSRERPFGTITLGIGAASRGEVIAIGKGTYDEALRLRGGETLIGACVEETVVRSTTPSTVEGVLNANRSGSVTVQNLRVGTSTRPGVAIGTNGSMTLENVEITGSSTVAILVNGHLDAKRLSVHDIAPRASGTGGQCVVVTAGSQSVIQGAVFERCNEIGLAGVGGMLTVSDTAVRRTLPGTARSVGYGAQIAGGCRFDCQRCVFEENHATGMVASAEGTIVSLSDTVLRDTIPNSADGKLGRALVAEFGPRVELRRVLMEDNVETALVVGGSETTSLYAEDLVIRRTRSRPSDGAWGRGIDLQEGGSSSLTRVLVTDVRQVGITANAGSSVELVDVTVSNVRPADCAAEGCPERELAIGFGSYRAARIDATRFEVRAAETCGVQIALEGEMDLRSGTVSSTRIGVCLQNELVDVARLTQDVLYIDNVVNLDATTLPVPETL